MMRHVLWITTLGLVAGSCGRDAPEEAPEAKSLAQTAPVTPPVRKASEDEDLRVLLGELVAKHACEAFEDKFEGLKDSKRKDVVTGTLWFRRCRIDARGERVDLALSGTGWRWADEKKQKAGGEFALRDHVRFDVDLALTGALDMSYDRDDKIASAWYTPSEEPKVSMRPIGDLEVSEEGAWSEVVGAAGTVIGKSPEGQAKQSAQDQGEQGFVKQFREGLSVTIDMCTGVKRVGTSRPGSGKMLPPDPGETREIAIELNQQGVAIFGPFQTDKGVTTRLRMREGRIHAALVCHDDAVAIAEAFAAQRPLPAVKELAGEDIGKQATLAIDGARCKKVALVTRGLSERAVFDWLRPAGEESLGPLVRCSDEQKKKR